MKKKWIRIGLTSLALILMMLLCGWAAADEYPIPARAQNLELNQKTTVTVEASQTTYVRFVSKETAYYELTSPADGNELNGDLYQAIGNNIMAFKYWHNSGRDFKVKGIMEKGKTYYFDFYYLDKTQRGSFPVLLEKKDAPGLVAEADGSTEPKVAPGETVKLRVVTLGGEGSLTYRWEGEGVPENQTTDVCEIENVTSKRRIYCYVSDESGNEKQVFFIVVVENGFSAAVEGAGEWRVQTILANLGDTAALKVSAKCTFGIIHYEWYRDDEVIQGANEAYYTVQEITGPSTYFCRVRDDYGNDTTVRFVIEVENKLWAKAIGETKLTAEIGETVTLRVQAGCTSGAVSYQWDTMIYDEEEDCYYVESVKGETGDSYTFQMTEWITRVSCGISDDYDNYEDISFDIHVENNFTAEADGPSELSLQPGQSRAVTWKVKASADRGRIYYRWYVRGKEIKGARGDSYTANIPSDFFSAGPLWYECVAKDINDDSRSVRFNVKVDTGLSANAVGATTRAVKYGEKLTLAVSAKVNRGTLTYRWYEEREDNQFKSVLVSGATGKSCTTKSLKCFTRYICEVRDEYGNQQFVMFELNIDNGLFAQADGPDYITVSPGSTATLKVKATANEGGFTYSWYQMDEPESGSYSGSHSPVEGATEASLTLENIRKHKELICVVGDKYGNRRSVYFTIAIANGFYAKSEVPSDLTAEPGGSVTMKVFAHADEGEISYGWYKMVTENGYPQRERIEGASGAEYTAAGVDRYTEYCCEVTDMYGNMREFDFRVSANNEFTVEAVGQTRWTVRAGDKVTLKVAAKAAERGFIYQWNEYAMILQPGYGGTGTLLNETGSSLTVGPVDHSSFYSCKVQDRYGNVQRVEFEVIVENGLTVAAAGPDELTVEPGQRAELKVDAKASKGKLTYYWYKYERVQERGRKWTRLTGAAQASYTTEPITRLAKYMCFVRDQYGTEEAIEFTVCVGSITALKMNEPAQARIFSGGDGAVFSFVPAVSGTYRIESLGSEDTYVELSEVMSGGARQLLDKDDDGGEGRNFVLENWLEAGRRYHYEVRFWSGEQTGTVSFLLTPNFEIITDAFVLPKGLTVEPTVPEDFGQPVSGTVSDGRVAAVSGKTVAVKAAGDATVTVAFENGAAVYELTVLSEDGVLKLPEGLEMLMEDAFSGDESIRIAELGSNVKTVGENALAAPNLAVAVIRGKTTQLDPDTFGDAKPLIVCPAGSEAEAWARQHECKLLYIP